MSRKPRVAGLFRWLSSAPLGWGEFPYGTRWQLGAHFAPNLPPSPEVLVMGVHYDARKASTAAGHTGGSQTAGAAASRGGSGSAARSSELRYSSKAAGTTSGTSAGSAQGT